MSIEAPGTESAGEPSRPRQFDELPNAVRQRIVEWAAAALTAAEPAEIPAALSRIAKFAPAKRAKVAGAALGRAVQADPAFRALVAARGGRDSAQHRIRDRTTGNRVGFTAAGSVTARAEPSTDPTMSVPDNADLRPSEADPSAAGSSTAYSIAADPIAADPNAADPSDADSLGTDPIDAAARGFLLSSPNEEVLLAAAAEVEELALSRARIAELERQVEVLAGKFERLSADQLVTNAVGTKAVGARAAANKAVANRAVDSKTAAGAQLDQGTAESTTTADRLRLRLRSQGTQIRELREQLAAQAQQTAEQLSAVTAERDRARVETESWRAKAEAAEVRAESAVAGMRRIREARGDQRATSDRRLELLLSALEGAASGLRREWDLVGGGPAPADVIAAGLPRPASDGVGGRVGERTTDPARLTAWVGMPGAHLIVDGYNVTKTGFGELSLSDQRDRLVRLLGALGARTSAEVTVVFDGAAVAAVRPPARGIRVLFSPPGVLADYVIRDLVRAEPVGRTVIVVSSDREVVDRAAADGARTAASTVLLAAFGG